MALADEINEKLRDFVGWNNSNPLPIGDPTTGVFNPSKSDLRALLMLIAQTIGDPAALDDLLSDIQALETEQNARDSIGQVILITNLTNTNGASYTGAVSTRQSGITPIVGTLYQMAPNFTNTVDNPTITIGGQSFNLRRRDGGTVEAGKFKAFQTYLMRHASDGSLRILAPLDAKDVEAKPDTANALTINAGAVYPLKAITRGGVLSAARPSLNDLLLDIKVKGATPGKYYRLEYYGNGHTTYLWGARISEYSSATYAADGTDGSILINYNTQQQPPTGEGIGVKTYTSAVRPGFEVAMTVDRSGEGSAWQMMTGDPALSSYSWIIDPTRYEYGTSVVSGSNGGALGVVATAGGNVSAEWQSGGRWYRVSLGRNGFNDLPNITAVSVAPDVAGVPGAWSTYSTGSTDWLPPLTFRATVNGDAGAMVYTGGNHGSNGDATGSQTAVNRVWRLLIDGQERLWSGFDGKADRLDLTIVNDLMAYNTISLGRYALRQVLSLSITPGGIEVHAEHIPLEPIELRVDNGLQIVTTGFQDTITVLGGDPAASGAFQNTTDSGAKADYPNAWAALFRNTTGDQMSVWMDRQYGAGTGSMVAPDRALIRPNTGGSSTKWYHAAASGMNTTLGAGQSYRWRGGYQWGKAGRPAPFTQGFDLSRAGQRHDVLITSPSVWMAAPPL